MDLEHNTQQAIVHSEGWLDKAPPMNKFYGYKSCKKRYFRLIQMNPENEVLLKKTPKKGYKQMTKLQEFYLVYWASEDVQKKPLRAIPINGSEKVNKFHRYEGEDKNLIHFLTEDRIYLLFAESEALMNFWHQKLTLVIDHANGTIPNSSRIPTNEMNSIYIHAGELPMDDAIYESMDEKSDDAWSISANSECSTLVNQSVQHLNHYDNYPCSSLSPQDSVSQAGAKPIQEANGSAIFQKVLRSEQTSRQMSEDTNSLLRRHYAIIETPIPRSRTSDGVIPPNSRSDPRETLDTERRPFSIATSDVRLGDIKLSNVGTPVRDVITENFHGIRPQTTSLSSVKEETESKCTKNYNLTIDDKCLTLMIYNNNEDDSTGVAGRGFHMEYGKYVIDLKKMNE